MTLTMCERFTGSMLGGLLGDVFGCVFEFQRVSSRSLAVFLRDPLASPAAAGNLNKADPTLLSYSDDTEMALSLAHSFVSRRQFDSVDAARRFSELFVMNGMWRGYGASVGKIFSVWRSTNFDDVFAPAKEQFSGGGSCGNGAAMRVHAVALACHSVDDATFRRIVAESARLTHTHPLGILGALIQAYAVRIAFHAQSCESLLDELEATCSKLEDVKSNGDCNKQPSDTNSFSAKLSAVRQLLSTEDVVITNMQALGNGVLAQESVPLAIYIALRSLTPLPPKLLTVSGDECTTAALQTPLARVVILSVLAGGDVDTIGSMAGAIVGAHLGPEAVPSHWLRLCEGVNAVSLAARELSELVQESVQ